MAAQGNHRRQRDTDDSHCIVIDRTAHPSGSPRHRRDLHQRNSGWRARCRAAIDTFHKLQDRYDLGFAVVTFLVVAGTIFNVFSLVSWHFHVDHALAWRYGCLGTGLWLFATAIFFFFLCDPYPKHRKRR